MINEIKSEKERQDEKKFFEIANKVYQILEARWENDIEELKSTNEMLKKALWGEKEAESEFVLKIKNEIDERKWEDTPFPSYYTDIYKAVYEEMWGMAGLAEWFEKDEYKESSSLKVIGDRIYFFVDGKAKLMTQRISKDRRKQLVLKLLSIKPGERMDKAVNQVLLRNGCRVTIFNEKTTKEGQDVIVFRRYVIPDYTFEQQALRGTIPKECIHLFKDMVKLGYNVIFSGALRTGKTTFMTTWQSHEDDSLEGILVETDPEIPLHLIMPKAPVMQIIADDDELRNIVKYLMRSDADYITLGEARDGVALNAFARIANKGTRRCKLTYHNRYAESFCYDAATEIVRTEGGNVSLTAERMAQSVDYIFMFIQLKDKSKKRLEGIYEVSYDRDSGDIITTQICKYLRETDSWEWQYFINKKHETQGMEENDFAFKFFKEQLQDLAQKYPAKNPESMIFKSNYRIASE